MIRNVKVINFESNSPGFIGTKLPGTDPSINLISGAFYCQGFILKQRIIDMADETTLNTLAFTHINYNKLVYVVVTYVFAPIR